MSLPFLRNFWMFGFQASVCPGSVASAIASRRSSSVSLAEKVPTVVSLRTW